MFFVYKINVMELTIGRTCQICFYVSLCMTLCLGAGQGPTFIGPCENDYISTLSTSHLSASQESAASFLSVREARLNSSGAWCNHFYGWRFWMQVDFGENIIINSLTTKGRRGIPQWTKSYHLAFSNDTTKDWSSYIDPYTGHRKVFVANKDSESPVENRLDNPMIARYMRIYPLGFKSLHCLRLGVQACRLHFDEVYYDWPPLENMDRKSKKDI